MEDTVEQPNNSHKADHLAPWQFKKGESGNLLGRYKGAKSGKERAKQMLANMDDSEWEEYMNGLSKMEIWKMAEGNPKTDTEITARVAITGLSEEDKEALNLLLNA